MEMGTLNTKFEPVEIACKEARQSFKRLLGVLFHPRRDILLLAGLKLVHRPTSRLFFNISNLDQVQHVAFTAKVFQPLRHRNDFYPTLPPSVTTILQRFEGLVQFTFVASDSFDCKEQTMCGEMGEQTRFSYIKEERKYNDLVAPARAALGPAQYSSID
ncbi:hypothetical protein BDZ45DRAFT_806195 [Acephala macrosclerotiorum]|nr:hypothetical protein BDZ45DRAFT_806195 [Acephala macrosclerotiorum]